MAENNKPQVVNDDENAKKALEAHKQAVEDSRSSQSSTIQNMLGKTEVVKIGDNTDHPYSLTLRFPGTARAQQIEDNCTVQYGNVSFTQLMQDAIRDVIVSPKIKSLAFWDSHVGFDEVCVKVLNFLNRGLAGELNK